MIRGNTLGVVCLLRGPTRHTIAVSLIGYARRSTRIDVTRGMDTTLVIVLEEEAIQLEGVVVLSTRAGAGRRIEEEPVRAEVVAREEIEEKMLMTPGGISMLLNETSGLPVQTTSPSLGGTNVRIRGLRGRYSADPLRRPAALRRAERRAQHAPDPTHGPGADGVIKGVASALYGASAMGGVVNLISRRPADDRELLLNQTTRAGAEAILWTSRDLSEAGVIHFSAAGTGRGCTTWTATAGQTCRATSV